MAKFVVGSQLVYLDGYDISDHVTASNWTKKIDSVDCTTMSDATRVYLNGLEDVELSVEGFDDFTTGEIDEIVYNIGQKASPNTNLTELTIVPQGATGGRAYSVRGMLEEHPKTWVVGDMAKFSLGVKNVYDGAIPGYLFEKDRAISAAGSGTYIQMGAVASGQTAYMIVHCTAVGSPSGISCNLQSCATSGGTYVTRVSSSALTAVGSQVVEVAGPFTDTYWKISWIRTSGSATVSVAAGIR